MTTTDVVKGTSPAALLMAGHPLSAIGSIATALPAADRASSAVLSRVSQKLGSGATKRLIPLLGAISGNALATTPNMVAPPQQTTPQQSILSGVNNNQGTQTMQPQQTPGIFSSLPGMGGSPQLEAQAMQTLTGMFDPYLMSGYAGPAATEAANLQKAQTASAALSGLLPQFQAAGGAQGPIAGLLSRIGATFTGGEAAKYGGQAQQAAQAISNATGIPLGQIQSYMPQITQAPQTAQLDIQQLKNILSSLGANVNTPALSSY